MLAKFEQIVFPLREEKHFWTWATCISILTIFFAFGTIFYPILSIVFFVGLLLCMIIFVKMEIGILASIFLYFILFRLVLLIFPQDRGYAEVIYIGSSIPVIITYLLWQLRKLSGLEKGSGDSKIIILLIFFIFWATVTLSWTDNPGHGLNLLYSMVINLFIVHMLSHFIQSRSNVYRLARFLAFFGAFLGLITVTSKWYLYEYTFGFDNTPYLLIMSVGADNLGMNVDMDNMRAGGFAPPNHAAFGLNIFLFAVISGVFNADSFYKKVAYLLVTIILIISLVLTGSKGGVGSMLVGLALVLFTNPAIKGRRLSWSILFGFVIIFSIICALMLGEGRLSESAKNRQASEMTNRSFSTRIEIWKRGFKESGNNLSLIYGYGLGASQAKAEILPHMHSFYFSTILDLGLIGMALFFCIIYYTFKKLRQCIKSTPSRYLKNLLSCFSGALVAALINGLVMAEFNFPFFWLLLGFILAVTTKSHYFETNNLKTNKSNEQAAIEM